MEKLKVDILDKKEHSTPALSYQSVTVTFLLNPLLRKSFQSEMLSTAALVRETLVIGTFNIGLPTTDVGTDGALIKKLFGGFPYHPNCTYDYDGPKFATCLAQITKRKFFLKYGFPKVPKWSGMVTKWSGRVPKWSGRVPKKSVRVPKWCGRVPK